MGRAHWLRGVDSMLCKGGVFRQGKWVSQRPLLAGGWMGRVKLSWGQGVQ